MRTYTRGTDVVEVSKSGPGSLPMDWQDDDGNPVDIAGLSITAHFTWAGDVAQLTSQIVDSDLGSFEILWTGLDVVDLPVGRVPDLVVTLADTSGNSHTFLIPVEGTP